MSESDRTPIDPPLILEDHPTVRIRSAQNGDMAFIFSSWMQGIRRVAPFRNMAADKFKVHHKTVEGLLCRSRVLIAADRNDDTHIIGYLVSEWVCPMFILVNYPPWETEEQKLSFVVHYLHVKRWSRRAGVATHLLKTAFPDFGAEDFWYTHRTRLSPMLEQPWKCKYHPQAMEDPNGSS